MSYVEEKSLLGFKLINETGRLYSFYSALVVIFLFSNDNMAEDTWEKHETNVILSINVNFVYDHV